ncbi:CSC1-like protein [Camellia lanceoleosa]|nr:CSC1-like protein [Camellia lanceoleosa]
MKMKTKKGEREDDVGGGGTHYHRSSCKELPVAFVTFRNRWGATLAAQSQQHSNPLIWITKMAPKPRDVLWRNLSIPYRHLPLYKIGVFVAASLLTLFFAIPVTAVQGIAKYEGLKTWFPPAMAVHLISDILKIVKDGIEYAFVDAPKQLSFLDGAVVHFISKLPTPDILEILKDVQKRTENVNTEVNGKALMLDEIINYVQSLQQGKLGLFLSMKLASVNPRLEFNMDSLLSKDPNGSFPHQTYPLDSFASAFFGQQIQEFPPVHTNLSNGDHTSTTLCQNNGMQLPPVDEFSQGLP